MFDWSAEYHPHFESANLKTGVYDRAEALQVRGVGVGWGCLGVCVGGGDAPGGGSSERRAPVCHPPHAPTRRHACAQGRRSTYFTGGLWSTGGWWWSLRIRPVRVMVAARTTHDHLGSFGTPLHLIAYDS